MKDEEERRRCWTNEEEEGRRIGGIRGRRCWTEEEEEGRRIGFLEIFMPFYTDESSYHVTTLYMPRRLPPQHS